MVLSMVDNCRIFGWSGRLIAEVVKIVMQQIKVYGVKSNCAHDGELSLAEMFPRDV